MSLNLWRLDLWLQFQKVFTHLFCLTSKFQYHQLLKLFCFQGYFLLILLLFFSLSLVYIWWHLQLSLAASLVDQNLTFFTHFLGMLPKEKSNVVQTILTRTNEFCDHTKVNSWAGHPFAYLFFTLKNSSSFASFYQTIWCGALQLSSFGAWSICFRWLKEICLCLICAYHL